MTSRAEQIGELERSFRAGLSANWAADKAGLYWKTAEKYYREFTARGIPRGELRRRTHTRRVVAKLPYYSGPALIGAQLTAAPVPIGADWIGKPV